jgi:predicted DCC family thiol-disulfide oxidoreductase YuxK
MILKYDRNHTLRFASLNSGIAREILERHRSLHDVDSLILITFAGTADEKVFIKSAAVLAIAAYLGGPWNLFRIVAVVPEFILNGLYDIVARHRYRLFGKFDACPLPSPETRSRFME